MDNAIYTTLTRQAGLWNELRSLANNIANADTAGFRAEGITFSEFVQDLGRGQPSLSMAAARVRETSLAPGPVEMTGAPLDLAIEGDAFFMIETPGGPRLTRAGAFTTNEAGDLVTAEGFPVLDAGGAPLFVPLGNGPVSIGADGTISAGGEVVGQVGLFAPAATADLVREDGVRFRATGEVLPAEGARVLQGFLEGSNVDPVAEVARLIEVQRAYELGQSFLEREDERIRAVLALTSR